MGNTHTVAQSCLNAPLPEKAIRRAIHGKDIGQVNDIIDVLLTGCTPTNFSYQDIINFLLPFTEDHFVVLPIWTLNLSEVQASAICMIKNWPLFSDEELEDSDYLSSIRVMLPLFKPGKPIGHARFMMFDNWEPMSSTTLQDEEEAWHEVIDAFVSSRDITQIIMDYDVLQRRQPPCKTAYTCKIIDSIPASSRVFKQDVHAFSDIVELIKDEKWCPDTCKRNPEMRKRLQCLRKFLCYSTARTGDHEKTAATPSPTIESTVLPSTTQTGLECIIITLCRVISTWLTPWLIPFEECRTLCQDKTGRRCLAELLVRSQIPPEELASVLAPCTVSAVSEGADITPPGTPPTAATVSAVSQGADITQSGTPPTAAVASTPVPVPSDNGTVGESASVPIVSPLGESWYSVYDMPTLSVHSPRLDYKPRVLEYNGVVGYTLYLECKWINKPRGQEFFPNTTVLSIGGTPGCLFICPVYQHIGKCKWHFLVLGTPGYCLFRAEGRRLLDAKGRSTAVHFQEASTNHAWTPPPTSLKKLEDFIADWHDPTFKQHRLSLDIAEEDHEVMSDRDPGTPDSKSGSGWLRRSKRKRTPRVHPPEPVTPVRRNKVGVTLL